MAIISFKHRLIFIKTTKTAGTSIETDLSQCVEPEAVVTPIFPQVPGHVPRNYQVGSDAEDGSRGYYNHMSAAEIRTLLGSDTFDSFTKFCVERDPVSKCISHFHMLHRSEDHRTDFADSWVQYCEAGKFPNDLRKYTEDRDGTPHLIVDHVLRYETLARDLPEFLATKGISGFELTARAKAAYSRNPVVTPAQVTPSQRQKIERVFARSIALTKAHWAAPSKQSQGSNAPL